jgi:hypothetical protein
MTGVSLNNDVLIERMQRLRRDLEEVEDILLKNLKEEAKDKYGIEEDSWIMWKYNGCTYKVTEFELETDGTLTIHAEEDDCIGAEGMVFRIEEFEKGQAEVC